MLYERWRQIARERGGECALHDLASGRQWSFTRLAAAAEDLPKMAHPIVCPQGHGGDFILAVLRAWRHHIVTCPIEPGQVLPAVPAPPQSCIHLKTTSATTGAPRLVAFTAEQLVADADNIVATMGLRPDWPNLAAISMAHSYGFSNLVLPLLLHGIPLFIAPSPLPEAIRRAAEGKAALTLAAVPALWRAWHEAGAVPDNVRLALSAGAPLSLSLEQAVFNASALKIHNFFGSSECGGIAYDATNTPRSDEASVGSPLQNVALTLNDEGCLQVHSRAVGETYWPDPSKSLGSGLFQTSDLADLKDGLVYLRGRLSDQINVAGRKTSPAVIEQALMEHAAVRECLAFGAPSEEAGRTEMIVACVIAIAPITAKNLREFLLRKLPAWQIPRHWWFVESLTANPRGKVSRTEWRKRFLESRFPATAEAPKDPG